MRKETVKQNAKADADAAQQKLLGGLGLDSNDLLGVRKPPERGRGEGGSGGFGGGAAPGSMGPGAQQPPQPLKKQGAPPQPLQQQQQPAGVQPSAAAAFAADDFGDFEGAKR